MILLIRKLDLKIKGVKHVGVTLSSDVSYINPVTSAQLVKTIIYTKALYGCGLWRLSKTELVFIRKGTKIYC